MFGPNGNTTDIPNEWEIDILGEKDTCRKNKHAFVMGVNQFLNRYLVPKLHSLAVSFCFDANFTSDVDHWISLAVRMGVVDLDLKFKGRDYHHSDCMQDFAKMKYYLLFWGHLSGAFDLKHLCLDSCIIMIPDSRRKINGLITIDLSHVPLVHNELKHIFHSCLNLKMLRVRHCRLPSMSCVSGAARLKVSFSGVPKLEKMFFYRNLSYAWPGYFVPAADPMDIRYCILG